jgi:hypothetical protein
MKMTVIAKGRAAVNQTRERPRLSVVRSAVRARKPRLGSALESRNE